MNVRCSFLIQKMEDRCFKTEKVTTFNQDLTGLIIRIPEVRTRDQNHRAPVDEERKSRADLESQRRNGQNQRTETEGQSVSGRLG